MLKIFNRKSSKCTVMNEFIKEDEPSLLLICESSLDKTLTELNRVKPIDANRLFYLNHTVCKLHEKVTLQDLRDVIIDSKYPSTEHVFIKDLCLNCEDSECEFINSVLESISNELNITITLVTTNQIHFRSVSNNKTTSTKEKELLSVEG